MAREIGIGIQDFSKMIENHVFYVDKTLFIKEWWESHDEVTLITRPRRFGKTLTMSMIEHFFSVKYAEQGRLFQGLAIWEDAAYHRLQGTYPVLSISFANVKQKNYEETRGAICDLIAREYNRYFFLLEGECLTPPEKEVFRRIAYGRMQGTDAASALNRLSEYLFRYYGRKTIILLDEYDTPMQEAYVAGYWEELADFMKSWFNATFKDDPWMDRGIMTGITRVSRESIFSDLNNLEVVTATSEKYRTAFGFTEEEVYAAMDEFGIGCKEEVKKWYDGFVFGGCGDIYNPWSILHFLDKRRFAPYWANTSSNSLVGKLIREGNEDIKESFECLLQGGHLSVPMDEQIVYDQLDDQESAVWSLLLASGYLKVLRYQESRTWGAETQYELALTNHEVRMMFQSMVHGWFSKDETAYNRFIKAMLADDKKAMNRYMERVALTTFSTFDTGNRPSGTAEPERFYHGFVLGLMVDLRDRYIITSNRESGLGRYDVMLDPRDKKKDDGIVLEFKVHDPEEESTLRETVNAALQQIKEKQYAASLEEKGIPPERIRMYGFAFEGKRVLIDGMRAR